MLNSKLSGKSGQEEGKSDNKCSQEYKNAKQKKEVRKASKPEFHFSPLNNISAAEKIIPQLISLVGLTEANYTCQ